MFLYSGSRLFFDAFRDGVRLLPGGPGGTQVLELVGALTALIQPIKRQDRNLERQRNYPRRHKAICIAGFSRL
jgi:hypothetical protein